MKSFAELKNKKIAVIGLGKSGVAVARFCSQKGARVVGMDDKNESQLAAALTELAPYPMELQLGALNVEVALSADLIVVSPGIPWSVPALAAAVAAKKNIIGEIELASWYIDAPMVGITGTNGKSTVTSLCGAIAEQTGRASFCGGNLGVPLIEVVGTKAAQADGIIVCEISSFQLETTNSFHCQAAALLNITPDHLDRYHSLQHYADTKWKITSHQQPLETLVLNADDDQIQQLVQHEANEKMIYYFSLYDKLPTQYCMDRPMQLGAYKKGSDLVLSGVEGGLAARLKQPATEECYPINELPLVGQHNWANAMAAFLLMRASGLATYQQVRHAASKFQALPHRMELVATHAGISYYDDSKGTNVEAVVAGLQGFPQPFALIAGGKDKGGSYAALAEVLHKNQVRGVVLIGEAAPLIEAALRAYAIPTFLADSLPEAVQKAASLCRDGDAVILSPACSSYDMFSDYAHRAQVFKQAVEELRGN